MPSYLPQPTPFTVIPCSQTQLSFIACTNPVLRSGNFVFKPGKPKDAHKGSVQLVAASQNGQGAEFLLLYQQHYYCQYLFPQPAIHTHKATGFLIYFSYMNHNRNPISSKLLGGVEETKANRLGKQQNIPPLWTVSFQI